MRLERNIDENSKLELKVLIDKTESYNDFKSFKKVFLPLIGEYDLVKQSEHLFIFKLPEIKNKDGVMILFQSDLDLLKVSGECVLFEYSWPPIKE